MLKVSPKFSAKKAHAMQKRLSKKLVFEDTLPEIVTYVGGVDIAHSRGTSIGAVAVLELTSLSQVESKVAHIETRFPYIPTLLSFREFPPAYSAIKKLAIEADVFLVDGQGFAHPYGLGFASHLGLVLDMPTIGVAKSRLWGKLEQVGENGWTSITAKGEIVGAEVIPKSGTKPIYVSVGHKISLERAIKIVKDCTGKYRIPEPIRRAHILAGKEKSRFESSARALMYPDFK